MNINLEQVDVTEGGLECVIEPSVSNNLKFGVSLLPETISINLKYMVEKFANQSNLKLKKNKDSDFSIFDLKSNTYIPIDSEKDYLYTNLPFIIFYYKSGSSERLYLFYTLADQVHTSYTKKEFDKLINMYLSVFIEQKNSALLTLNYCENSKNYKYFIEDPLNTEFINEITLISDFQVSLSQITGVEELAFVRPNVLHFQDYQGDSLSQLFNSSKNKNIHKKIQGGRIDYKADTHLGVKPFFLNNTIIPYLDKVKEIYWLNTRDFPINNNFYKEYFCDLDSSIEEQNFSLEDEGFCFEDEGFCFESVDLDTKSFDEETWQPNIQDFMKIVFAEYLTYKTYRPDQIIPRNLNRFNLVFFNYLYLIDFIKNKCLPLNIETTTAYKVLKHIIDNDEVPRSDSTLTPYTIQLPLQNRSFGGFFTRSANVDRVEIINIPSEYLLYKINAVVFTSFIEKAYILLSKETGPDKQLFQRVFLKALDDYLSDMRERHQFITAEKTKEMITLLCKIYAVDINKLELELPDKVFKLDFELILRKIEKMQNTDKH